MLVGQVAAYVALFASLAEGQLDQRQVRTTTSTTTRATSTSATITTTNTVFKCDCVFPTNSLRPSSGSGTISTITTTFQPSTTFACNCASSKLVSTTRSTSVRTTSAQSTSRASTSALSTSRVGTSSPSISRASSSAQSTSRASTSASSSSNRSSSVQLTSSSSSSTSSTNTVIVTVTPSSSAVSSSVQSSSTSVPISTSSSLASSSVSSSSVSLSPSSSASSSVLSTSSATSSAPIVSPSGNATTNSTLGGQTVANTILILARNTNDAFLAKSGLDGYSIPYQVLLVPRTGVALPTLNSSTSQGNYGGFIMVSELSYQNSAGNWVSGLTEDQFNTIYAYQKAFGVRMTRLDTYPWSAFGAVALGTSGGCCEYGVEQLVSFTNTSGFPTAGVKSGAKMSTKAIWHYPAKITDPSTTWEVAGYDPSSDGGYGDKTTAAVINDFEGRQQMVFFTGWATEWSATSSFLQHAYIHWMTRGLFVGARKTYLSAQIDDVHLRTQTYRPLNNYYRSIPKDYQMHADWQVDINSRLPAGSDFFLELGHNGNGDIIAATNGTNNGDICSPNNAIYYISNDVTALEYQKPLGSGTSAWPNTPSNYTWSVACASTDDLARWFMNPVNRDAFAHISHTFTHLHQNNATYDDINKEILFNQVWLNQTGIANARRFSPAGLIPPAITGMHNGDAIRAWYDNGLRQVVGDNSRPVLRQQDEPFWPLLTTVDNNGFDGMVILPRWPTRIYYDCDLPACTTQEWTDLFGGTGSFTDLLALEQSTTTRYLLGLHHDLYMFHQANLRANDVATTTVGTQSGQFSLVQIWTETVVQEMMRLTTWSIVTLKHDDIAQKFLQRMARDQCNPNLAYNYSQDGSQIVGVTVSADGNACSAPIPVTFPGPASGGAATDDKVGSEPLIKWITLSGSTQTYTLAAPVSVRS